MLNKNPCLPFQGKHGFFIQVFFKNPLKQVYSFMRQ
jgi:hypothetical protein